MLSHLVQNGKPNEEYISFSLGEEHERPGIELFYKKFILLRKEKKLDVKALVNLKVRKTVENSYTEDELKTVNIRYTDFNFPQGVAVFRDNTILMNWREKAIAIKISSKTP